MIKYITLFLISIKSLKRLSLFRKYLSIIHINNTVFPKIGVILYSFIISQTLNIRKAKLLLSIYKKYSNQNIIKVDNILIIVKFTDLFLNIVYIRVVIRPRYFNKK